MKNNIFSGSAVALVTPFDKNDNVDYKRLADLIEFHIASNTSAVVVCGTTGESPTLSHKEKIKITEESVKIAAGRIPIISGTGSNNFLSAKSLSIEAQKCGADALLIITPYYNKTSQTGIIKYFYGIADAVEIPIIMYDVPSRTGMEIKLETYKELSEHPNIAAVKDAKGDLDKIIGIKQICGDKIDIYSGCDDLILPYMSCGAKGVISVTANIYPNEIAELCGYCENNDYMKALDLQKKLYNINKALFSSVNPIPIKSAMRLIGKDCGKCRMPLYDLNEKETEQLNTALL